MTTTALPRPNNSIGGRIAATFSSIVDLAVEPAAYGRRAAFMGSTAVALLLLVLLMNIGLVLERPAYEKVTHTSVMQRLQANGSDASAQETRDLANNLTALSVRIAPFITSAVILVQMLLSALITSVAATLLNGRADYKKILYIVAHVCVLSVGFAQLITGVVVYFTGPGAYESARDIVLALPSAAWLAAHAAPSVRVALATVNPFTVWQIALVTLCITSVTRLRIGKAILAASAPVGIFAAFASLMASH